VFYYDAFVVVLEFDVVGSISEMSVTASLAALETRSPKSSLSLASVVFVVAVVETSPPLFLLHAANINTHIISTAQTINIFLFIFALLLAFTFKFAFIKNRKKQINAP
jgi:hypothetical protein